MSLIIFLGFLTGCPSCLNIQMYTGCISGLCKMSCSFFFLIFFFLLYVFVCLRWLWRSSWPADRSRVQRRRGKASGRCSTAAEHEALNTAATSKTKEESTYEESCRFHQISRSNIWEYTKVSRFLLTWLLSFLWVIRKNRHKIAKRRKIRI